jgi:putative effector of murein hydrolase
MGLTYLFIKIFPFFGIALTVVAFDLARNFRRKGNRAWIGTIAFSLLFALMTLAWIGFRGDKNADLWFRFLTDWLHGK